MKLNKDAHSSALSRLVDVVRIGIVSTTLDAETAYVKPGRLTDEAAYEAWHEIRSALLSFKLQDPKPEFVILPEISVPRRYVSQLKQLAASLNTVILAGMEYGEGTSANSVRNEVLIYVPYNFGKKRSGRGCNVYKIGKSDPARIEDAILQSWGVVAQSDPAIRVLVSEEFGNFGVVICSDLLDLQRMYSYWGQIDHLLVLAYNQDVDQFCSLADNLSKLLFCNVAICNTGTFGGSVVYAPYHRPENLIYTVLGSGCFAFQVLALRVKDLRSERYARSPAKISPRKRDLRPKSVPPRMPDLRLQGASVLSEGPVTRTLKRGK